MPDRVAVFMDGANIPARPGESAPAEVDHFIAWRRHPTQCIENLVVADRDEIRRVLAVAG